MRNDYTEYLYHSKFFNSDGSKKQHKYTARKWVKDKWQYIYKTADKVTNGALTKAHNEHFDKKQAELKTKRESGYAESAKNATDKKREEFKQYKTNVLTKRADERGKSIADDMKAKQASNAKKLAEKKHEAETKVELEQHDKAKWAREASNTYFGLDDLNRIDRNDVGTTLEETSKINPDYTPSDLSTSHNCGFCATAWVLRKKGYDVEAKHDDENATWNDFGDTKTGITEYDAANMFVDLSKVETNEKYGTSTFFNFVPNADKRYKIAYEGLDGNTYHMYFNDINEIIGEKEDNKRANYMVSAEFNGAYNRPYEFEKTAAEAEQEILQNSKDGDYGILTVSWNLGGGHALNYQVENGKVVVYDGQVNESYSFEELFRSTRKINYMNCTSLIPTDNVNLVVQNRRKS